MITQQVAAYLIKKMTAVVKNPSKKAEDSTDELFKNYLLGREHRKPKDIFVGGSIDGAAIVDAFKWRAADLVSRPVFM
jgi:acyl-CoA oxidase